MKKTNYELFILIFLLIFAAIFMYDGLTSPIPKVYADEAVSPYGIPIAIIGLLMFLCSALLIKNIVERLKVKKMNAAKIESAPIEIDKDTMEKRASEKKKNMKITVSIVMIIAYVLSWELIGFLLATMLFVVAQTMILPEKPSIKMSLLVAVITTGSCQLVFHNLFRIQFPTLF